MSVALYIYCKTMFLSDGRFPAIIRLMKGIRGGGGGKSLFWKAK